MKQSEACARETTMDRTHGDYSSNKVLLASG